MTAGTGTVGAPSIAGAAISWAPAERDALDSQLAQFIRHCEAHLGRRFEGWLAFHAWSVEDHRTFWRLFVEWSGLLAEGEAEPVCVGDAVETARFFPALRLSYAENLLRPLGDDERTAVSAWTESGAVTRVSRRALRDRVRRLAAALEAAGVREGDRVVALARNTIETIVACLATSAVGAVWSSANPDLGTEAVVSRFGQLDPVLLFAHRGYTHHGVHRPLDERVRDVAAALPSLRAVVALDDDDSIIAGLDLPVRALGTLEAAASPGAADRPWRRLPFDHPLFVLFSSGTTGAPKCIVHGAGGTLLEHLKEHRLHSDLGAADRLYFHTTCGWMMWNWQLSALASGTEIVLWDGSVSYPEPDALVRMLASERVTVFGASPAYFQFLRDAGISPAERVDLSALRAIQSTGSILFDAQYDWIVANVKHVPIQSISGGTDIVGCFVLGNPMLPVYRGESQCVSLALDVRAWTPEGTHTVGTGELVCVRPFPSRPVGLFNDPDGSRFHAAYFAQHEGTWTHGDFVQLTERGTARILGRSDGTLNVRGVRIGPAELYAVVQDIPGIEESMALEQEAPREPGGSRLVLLVVLAQGLVLDRALTLRIKKELSQRASAAHVPAVIAQVPALPTTHSGKRSERAARDAMHGRTVVNASALRNPECLDAIRAHPALQA